VTIEEQMAELVDRIAAEPATKIDPRAWEQLRVYAPFGQREEVLLEALRDIRANSGRAFVLQITAEVLGLTNYSANLKE
jgi:hypothetical protein